MGADSLIGRRDQGAERILGKVLDLNGSCKRLFDLLRVVDWDTLQGACRQEVLPRFGQIRAEIGHHTIDAGWKLSRRLEVGLRSALGGALSIEGQAELDGCGRNHPVCPSDV